MPLYVMPRVATLATCPCVKWVTPWLLTLCTLEILKRTYESRQLFTTGTCPIPEYPASLLRSAALLASP